MDSHQIKLSDKSRETINPYLHYGNLLLSRLIWDLSPYSWVSRRRIRSWRNKLRGRKAIILCNGPSLNKVDFKALEKSGIFSFGLNKINLLFSKTSFRPSVIVSVNPYVMEQNAKFYNTTDLPLFLDSKGRKFIRFRKNVHFLHGTRGLRKFAKDCSFSIIEGTTVTFVAMQLAFHMGFTKVGLVGCDHSFATKGPANQIVSAGKMDKDHFDSRYFINGNTWQLPDLLASEIQYDTARNMFEENGRKLLNCTVGGILEILERQPLEEFIDS